MVFKSLGIAATVVAAVVLASSVASARALSIPLDCGAAGQFDVLTNGDAEFTPGRIVGGGVLHPTAFMNQHFTFTDNEGNVIEGGDPDSARRGGPKGVTIIHCSFSGSFSDENGSGTFTGELDGWISPN